MYFVTRIFKYSCTVIFVRVGICNHGCQGKLMPTQAVFCYLFKRCVHCVGYPSPTLRKCSMMKRIVI